MFNIKDTMVKLVNGIYVFRFTFSLEIEQTVVLIHMERETACYSLFSFSEV